MQLPDTLRQALGGAAEKFKLTDLQRAHERLSESYRAGRPLGRLLGRLNDAERVAYAVARMPATFGACSAVLGEVAARIASGLPRRELTSLLDLGAGTGSLLWAAAENLPGISRATLVEADAGMIQLGRTLTGSFDGTAPGEVLRTTNWIHDDLRTRALEPHDLVACSYSLGELERADAERVLRAAWTATKCVLVIIEPGTPLGFARVRQWREQLLEMGAHMVAPCPHARACPLSDTNWCHFAQRVERTSLHRRLKGGELGYEDEKFSYLAVSRFPLPLPAARIVRHPQVAPGAVHLELCTAEGLRKITATKKDRQQFPQARHARWGEPWPPPNDDGKELLRSAGE